MNQVDSPVNGFGVLVFLKKKDTYTRVFCRLCAASLGAARERKSDRNHNVSRKSIYILDQVSSLEYTLERP